MDSLTIDAITAQLADHLGTSLHYHSHQPLYGGDINQSYLLKTSTDSFFLKLNKLNRLSMFEAEALALETISRSNTVRVPTPILSGTSGAYSFLLMEFVDMVGSSSRSDEHLGQQLASMHRAIDVSFGWERDNTIGSTPQINHQEHDWTTFWKEHRLSPQLDWAGNRGGSQSLITKGERLISHFECLFVDYQPTPSLLHGDLWGGNYSAGTDSAPIIYDPALYYGDRETDLAMTELFGGFSSRFYSSYNEAWPLDEGYSSRKTLYNLYHILNHYNLFGGGYGHQAERMVDQLLQLV